MQQDISFARFLTRYASRVLDVTWHRGKLAQIDVKGELFDYMELANFTDICNSRGVLVITIN